MRSVLRATCALSSICVASLSPYSLGEEPSAARALLEKVAETHRRLPALIMWGTLTTESLDPAIELSGTSEEQRKSRLGFVYRRPGEIRLALGDGFLLLSDGKEVVSVSRPYYSISPAVPSVTSTIVSESPLRVYFSASGCDYHIRILLELLTGESSVDRVLSLAGGVPELIGDKEIDGNTYQVVSVKGVERRVSVLEIQPKKSPDIRIFVDKKSFLLSRIEIDFPYRILTVKDYERFRPTDGAGEGAEIAIGPVPPTGVRVTWNVQESANQVTDPRMFAYVIAEDYIKVAFSTEK